jgi:putative hydroxymethylpyrimidine transport system permease protein
MSPKKKRAIGVLFLVFLIVLWQIISLIIGKSYLLPGPVDVVENIWENRIEIFTVHLPATLQVVISGGIISVVLGFFLAMIMDMDSRVEKALYPVLTATQTIPVMCIAPVFVLWFGYTVTMRIIVVVLLNFFSVAVNVFDGLKSTNTGRTELMLTYGASRLQRFFLLRLPTALPYLFTALKVVVPWSFVGAAVSEWLGAPSGLGIYSRNCMAQFDAAGLLAPLAVLTVLALILNGVIYLAEKKIITWKGEV